MSLVEGAGFADMRLGGERYDVFSDAPSASSAAAFGTEGVTLSARKPAR